MPQSVGQALSWAARAAPATPHRPRLLVAGAGGALGAEVTRRLIASAHYDQVLVLTHGPMQAALRGVTPTYVPAALQRAPQANPPHAMPAWPTVSADVAVIMFEPPRGRHGRERALWTPEPGCLPGLAAWLLASGVRDLLLLTPHQRGRLPQALQDGLANIDEAALALMDFDRLLVLRAAREPLHAGGLAPLPRLADWMLGIFRYMVPSAQQPLRAPQLAQLVDVALTVAPPGVHVLGPEALHAAAQGDAVAALRATLGGAVAADPGIHSGPGAEPPASPHKA